MFRVCRGEVRAPFGAGPGGGFGGVAIGGEVAGDGVGGVSGLVGEGDVEAEVGEGVGGVVEFVGVGAVEGEGEGLPLDAGAGDGDVAVAVGLAGLLERGAGGGGVGFRAGGGLVGFGRVSGLGFGFGEDEFVEFESVFAHGEVDCVVSGLIDIEVDFAEDAAVSFVGALFVVPVPAVFGGPLHALAGFGPLSVEAEVDSVVFGAGGVGADPAVVAAGVVDFDAVGEDGDFAGVGEKFSPLMSLSAWVRRVSGRISR